MPVTIISKGIIAKIVLALVGLGLLSNPLATTITEITEQDIKGIEQVEIREIVNGYEIVIQDKSGDIFGGFIDEKGNVIPDKVGKSKDGEILITSEKHKKIIEEILKQIKKHDDSNNNDDKNKDKEKKPRKSTRNKKTKTPFLEKLKNELQKNFSPQQQWKEINLKNLFKKIKE